MVFSWNSVISVTSPGMTICNQNNTVSLSSPPALSTGLGMKTTTPVFLKRLFFLNSAQISLPPQCKHAPSSARSFSFNHWNDQILNKQKKNHNMKNGGRQITCLFIFIHDSSGWKRRWLWFTKVTHVLQWMRSTLLLFLFEWMVLSPLVIFSLHPLKYRVHCSGIHLKHDPAQTGWTLYEDGSWLHRSVLVVSRVYLGQSNLTLSDDVMSPSMVWDTRRKRMGGWLVSSWNFPVPNKNNKSS